MAATRPTSPREASADDVSPRPVLQSQPPPPVLSPDVLVLPASLAEPDEDELDELELLPVPVSAEASAGAVASVPASTTAGTPQEPLVQVPVEHSRASAHAAPSAFLGEQLLVPVAPASPASPAPASPPDEPVPTQYSVALQSASAKQLFPQAPVPLLQTRPAWIGPPPSLAAQSADAVHLPQVPSALA